MPRFLSMIRVDEEAAQTNAPDPEFGERMGALFEEVTKAGVMLDTAGLTPSAQGTRVTWSDGQLTYTDGPFTESKEVVGGYAILQAKDKAEALEWTKRFLQTHPNSWNVTAELREIAEM
jgi:hypothetical protein